MARAKDKVPSERIRWDGNRKRGITERDDRVFEWNDANMDNDRFGMVWELVASALAGELGPQVKAAVEHGDDEAARDALADLLETFG